MKFYDCNDIRKKADEEKQQRLRRNLKKTYRKFILPNLLDGIVEINCLAYLDTYPGFEYDLMTYFGDLGFDVSYHEDEFFAGKLIISWRKDEDSGSE